MMFIIKCACTYLKKRSDKKAVEEENKNGTYNTLFHWHDFKFKLVIEGALVGFFAGFIIVLYRLGVEKNLGLYKEAFCIKDTYSW